MILRPPTPPRQRGAALLMAMLILSLVATLAAAMVWQQWRAVQVEAAERARAQSAWILVGALDWARLILSEDGRKPGLDHLGEPWAVPLAEARLSSFLAADKDRTDDGPEAFLSGSITDAQARYNLSNLFTGGQVSAAELKTLQTLLDNLGIDASLATTIATGLRDALPAAAPDPASAPANGTGTDTGTVALAERRSNPPLLPQDVAQLAWLGLDAATLGRLQGHVDLLPTRTKVNLNTASREVLAAVIDGLDLAGAQRLVQARERQPFQRPEDATAVLGSGFTLDANRVGVDSSYFEVRGRLRLADRVLEERSLVRRNGTDVIALSRERVSSQQALP
jgi:general secretion pathway protein K